MSEKTRCLESLCVCVCELDPRFVPALLTPAAAAAAATGVDTKEQRASAVAREQRRHTHTHTQTDIKVDLLKKKAKVVMRFSSML